ncbi:hypothetical protein F8388_012620 [Cannabis sativa]|uniref:Reverse transcriptase zinc-binding domain-containing protein n=1 Tax=Cannabis sativa TaxID=3483 RepID=A0A7J6HE32_CANSA|nr:hypothetical protein F8388_012620 [Cannabis sativa]
MAKLFYNSLITAEISEYAPTIWHKICVPKHRFICWQAINDHLLTRDHLSRVMEIVNKNCHVCEMHPESHNHVFFECHFAKLVMTEIGTWFGLNNWPSDFKQWKDWCSKKLKNLLDTVMNTIMAAAVYFLWLNKNGCWFNRCCRAPGLVSREIKNVVKYKIMSCSFQHLKGMDLYIINLVAVLCFGAASFHLAFACKLFVF